MFIRAQRLQPQLSLEAVVVESVAVTGGRGDPLTANASHRRRSVSYQAGRPSCRGAAPQVPLESMPLPSVVPHAVLGLKPSEPQRCLRRGEPAGGSTTGTWGAMAIDAELFGDVLPTYLTRFVGRKRECRALAAAVDGATLVTVCGVGGAGKTRLATEVTKQIREAHADDTEPLQVYWVPPLSAVTNPAEVGPAVATAIALPGSFTITSAVRSSRCSEPGEHSSCSTTANTWRSAAAD